MEKIYSKHAVRAVLLARPRAVRRLILAGKESYYAEILALARRARIEPEHLAWSEFLRVAELDEEERHQGVCAFVKPRRIYTERDLGLLAEARAVLALDQVSDPQNFATMLRAAAFFGIDAVLFLKNRSVEVSPTVVRLSVGGAEFVKIFRVTNLSQSLEKLKEVGFWVYGLDAGGERTLAETEFGEKTLFVVGAEGEGLRKKTKKYCDALVRIPGGREGLESLNAGVATAIALAELSR